MQETLKRLKAEVPPIGTMKIQKEDTKRQVTIFNNKCKSKTERKHNSLSMR